MGITLNPAHHHTGTRIFSWKNGEPYKPLSLVLCNQEMQQCRCPTKKTHSPPPSELYTCEDDAKGDETTRRIIGQVCFDNARWSLNRSHRHGLRMSRGWRTISSFESSAIGSWKNSMMLLHTSVGFSRFTACPAL
jgi:hypothetical protein